MRRTLDLVEFRQVCPVDGLIPEDAVDGEVLGGLEDAAVGLLVLRQPVQHATGHRRGVRPQQVLLCLRGAPVVAVAAAARL